MNQGKKRLLIAIHIVCFLFLTGCSFSVSIGNKESTEGSHQIEVQVQPNPAVILKENEFYIFVRDQDGKPVENAKVKVTLSMADMDHGDLSFFCDSISKGVYKGKGIPVMAGEWIATVSVEQEGEKSTLEYVFQASR